MEHFDIIVAGGGPAGLTAALYAARAGKSVLVLEMDHLGGQIAYAPLVENYPGIPGLRGADFAESLAAQVEGLGAVIEYEQVLEVRPGAPITVVSDMGERTCSALILATGAAHRPLGLPGEEELVGCGVSYCALCDGAFYAGKEVAVVGGGNSAVQEAIFLSDLCARVTLIHRRDRLRADAALAKKLEDKANIRVLYSHRPAALLQENDSLTGIRLLNAAGEDVELKVDGLFVAVGRVPQSEPFAGLGLCHENGFYAAGEDGRTAVPGIFAAGDGREKAVRQLTTACADGAAAATAACAYLDTL